MGGSTIFKKIEEASNQLKLQPRQAQQLVDCSFSFIMQLPAKINNKKMLLIERGYP
jgi:hypothetical protein